MNKIKYLLCIVLCLHLTQISNAQELNTTSIDAYISVYQTEINTNPKKAQKAVQKWLELSIKQNDVIKEAQAHYALANIGNTTGNYKQTVKEAPKAITILKAQHIELGLPACYNVLALGYKNLGQYPEAMDAFLLCLNYAEKTDDKQQQANAYQNISTLYILQKNYEKAANNLDRAAQIYRALGDDNGVLVTLFNFANILKEQGRYQEAYKHYKTVLDYRIKEGNKASIAYVKINLSQLLVEEGNYEEAIPQLNETLGLLEELKFTSDMAIVLNDLGICHSKLGHTAQAIDYFERSLKIGKSKSLAKYNSKFYKNLSNLYKDIKNYKQALYYYEKTVSVTEDINSVDKENYVANLQEQYETELKETRIKLLEKEQKLSEAELEKTALNLEKTALDLDRQRLVRNIFIAAFIILLGVLILLRYLYLQRIKIQHQLTLQKEENAKQQINQLVKDHKLSVIEKYQDGQDEERSRLSREIHDGIGSDLASIKIGFEHYLEAQKPDPQAKRLLQAIEQSCKDVRLLSHQLHPLPFSKIGFSSFLKEALEQIKNTNALSITTFLYPEESIDELPEVLLADTYRIIQELLNNTIKHANATEVEVQLNKHTAYLNLVVSDNGSGFKTNNKPGIGIRNIKERVQKRHGDVTIDSSPQHGTSTTINFPL
ncbi:tetratricopeptide repeat protein [Psychroserpens sp. NJDZ02]|uniref:tetratricopeptide repeat-containing sensor histidine kinase n=1 Tax=Psychroserpens sp. NJDZ02 TaxID=2570561 RepID=UPI001F0E6D75|nr:tetratricopeptide repeat protein [Psychroserpens sp. NJDZ02]